MDFKEAFEKLMDGEAIRRKSWPNTFHMKIIKITDDNGYIQERTQCFRQETVPFSHDINIILSNDWIVIGEENIKMPFLIAIEKLKQGHKVKLSDWEEKTFIEISENGRDLIMRRMCQYEYIPSFNCFLANDWEVY